MSAYKNKILTTKFFIALVDETPIEHKKKEILKCLEEGANVNERFTNDSDNTPLHVSVLNGDVDIVNLLLKHGAQMNYKNSEGKTPVEIA